MRVLITGGAGFIGFHLAQFLAMDSSNKVTICDNLFRGQADDDFKNLIKQGNVEFINIDLTKKEELSKLGRDYDIVYHLAAINGTKYFYEVPHEVLRTNILSLINILDWLASSNCRKMVWTSSSETYAGAAIMTKIPIPTPEEVPLAISDVFNPRFSYAGSKIIGELLCLNYAKAYELTITIVRPHNIYGPRMGHEHVIPGLITRIIQKDDPFKIYGGNQSRAFCYIEDFVKGITLVAESPRTNIEIINIGNDKEEITIIDLAQKMLALFHFQPKLNILSSPPGSVNRRCPDITKARTLVGYEPQVDLDTGLQRTYDWYHQHRQ